MAARIRLKVGGALVKPQELEYDAHDVVLFGRSPQCHCSIPDDPFLSGNHFIIELNPPECVLRDLGSRNGTRVNGILLEKSGEEDEGKGPRIALKNGDLITAGTVEIRVEITIEASPEPASKTSSEKLGDIPESAQTWANFPGLTFLSELAEGGMGKVYLVRITKGNKLAVLKNMVPNPTFNEERSRRYFFREIECTKGLKHPNIVKFLDGGCFDGKFYFLLEYCSEGSIEDLMQKTDGRVPLDTAAPLMLQAMDALEYAHEHDIVHRDIKPANILLSDEGGRLVAKISDFGLAKDFRLAGMSGVTEIDMAAGSLSFAPREQLLNFRYTQPASDIFSIGATFYAMLTGKAVYAFDSGKEPLEMVLSGKIIPLRKRAPELPKELAKVIDKAISVEVKDRQPSASVLKAELAAALN